MKPSADRFDDSGPYKADMMARMEQLNRGDRVQPPCDRCRRLHMDCLKNLTACMGCTKKHAKCSWKDVEEQELKDHPFVVRVKTAEEIAAAEESDGEGGGSASGSASRSGESGKKERTREMMEVRDEELLGEDSGDDDLETTKPTGRAARSISPLVMSQAQSKSHQPERVGKTSTPSPLRLGVNSPLLDSVPQDASMADERPKSGRSAGATTPSDPNPWGYQAPKAQMQPYSNRYNDRTPETKEHVQSEYEKDIYSQLNEATRESIHHEKRNGHSHEESAMESAIESATAYVGAGDKPLRLSASPMPIMQRTSSPDPPPPIQTKQEQQEESSRAQSTQTSLRKSSPNPPTSQEQNTIPMPQMPSPPLSGVPSHATPTPSTPVPDLPFATAAAAAATPAQTMPT